MKRLISILLTVAMLVSMFVMVIPANAATNAVGSESAVVTDTTDQPLKFKSGLSNLWYTDKQMTALPGTIEATIDVPAKWFDTYEGHVMAWNSVNNTTGHFMWIDVIRKDANNGDKGENTSIRVLMKR